MSKRQIETIDMFELEDEDLENVQGGTTYIGPQGQIARGYRLPWNGGAGMYNLDELFE